MTEARTRERREMGLLLAAVIAVLIVLAFVVMRGAERESPGTVSTELTPSEFSLVPASPPAEPVRLPERGAYVNSEIRRDGTVDVTHWIRASTALDTVTLRAHAATGAPDAPQAEDLQIRTSQGEIRFRRTQVTTEPLVVDLVRPTLLIKLTYTLTGVAQTTPDKPGRALIGIVDLDVTFDGEEGRDRVQVGGRSVLSLSCNKPGAGPGKARPCGQERDGGWSVNLIGRDIDDRVTAQVNLNRKGDR